MNLANLLTSSRLLLAPIVYWLAIKGWGLAATACFVFAACTDGFDGYVARTRGEITNLGKLFDPVADKMLQILALAAVVQSGFVPLWLALLVVGKEALLLVGGLAMLRLGHVVSARFYGKLATVFLFIGLAGGLAGLWFMQVFFWIGAAISLLAGLDYLVQAVRTLTSSMKTG